TSSLGKSVCVCVFVPIGSLKLTAMELDSGAATAKGECGCSNLMDAEIFVSKCARRVFFYGEKPRTL
ncbi:hypothetical protein, partial [Saccharicrinis sp. GN24d3]|uniref:hypothetical protein n=1 Tax=Saccharicrinis sp. GN24d3 TaxID=3458416 RepID=UPI004035CF50